MLIKTEDKTIDKLYDAVIAYIEKRQGSVAVIGGITLVEEDERKFHYGIMVRITGKKPIFERDENA